MSGLTDFLLARIAEDEAVAQAATTGPWRWDGAFEGDPGYATQWGHEGPDLVSAATSEHAGIEGPADVVLMSWGHDADGLSVTRQDGDHIARHDPARVLAECEAKRRIVEMHCEGGSLRGPVTDNKFYCCEICGPHEWPMTDAPPYAWVPEPNGDFWPCETLRILASVYADRPDYREEWRP